MSLLLLVESGDFLVSRFWVVKISGIAILKMQLFIKYGIYISGGIKIPVSSGK